MPKGFPQEYGSDETTYRNGVPLYSRGPEIDWWLTGFKWVSSPLRKNLRWI